MPTPFASLGGYVIFDAIAAGGAATVHLGRRLGAAGFGRTVAIKRLHDRAGRGEPVASLLDEARLASRIHHANVVQVLDVIEADGEVLLVMDYVRGESLGLLLARSRALMTPVPLTVAVAVVVQALRGLHAAHEAIDEAGRPLGLVHRDVSPQNILVGVDGIARVVDFGVAKARGRQQVTQEGVLKGKLPYMAPEQLEGRVTRQSDLFAAGLVLWELIVGRRHYDADSEVQTLYQVMQGIYRPARALRADVPPALEEALCRALRRAQHERFPSAEAMASALERAVPVAGSDQIGRWVERWAAEALAQRDAAVARVEAAALGSVSTPPVIPAEPARWPRVSLAIGALVAASVAVAASLSEAPPTGRAPALHADARPSFEVPVVPRKRAIVEAKPLERPAPSAPPRTSVPATRDAPRPVVPDFL